MKAIATAITAAMLLAAPLTQAQSDKPAFTSKFECDQTTRSYIRKIVKKGNVSTNDAILILVTDPIRSESLLGWLDGAVYPLWKSRCMKYYQ